MAEQPFLFGPVWIEVKDGDETVRSVFDRHYSRYRYKDGRKPKLFVGPGEKMVLVSPCARAVFAWRKFLSADGQQGVNCAIFRNEGAGRSSDLIRAADAMAWERWPGERHYTYVNPRKLRSTNPGFCFLKAGWRRCGVTKHHKLIILERTPDMASRQEVYEAIDSERDYQDAQRGNAKRHEGQPPMTPGELILCMEKCLADARVAWYAPDGGAACLPHIRKVSALGVQAMERYGAPKRA